MGDERIDELTAILTVEGELDLFSSPEFKQRLLRLIDAGARHVIVDLSATSFVDSTVLGVLISSHRRLGLRGGRLVVAATHPSIRRVLDLTGVSELLVLAATRRDALARLTAS
jgi:anti-sigma B factor antagonist